MLCDPNPGLLTSLLGRVGAIRFQRYATRILARLPWTIRALPTNPMVVHRLAVTRAAMLWGSVTAQVAPAWASYAAALPYGPFAAWQKANILACKAGDSTAITPPNPLYAPLSDQAWSTDSHGNALAQWAYAGAPAEATVYTWARIHDTYAWTPGPSADAADLELELPGLTPGETYELALAPLSLVDGAWGQSYHEFRTPLLVSPQDFDTWTQVDPNGHIDTDLAVAYAHDLTRNEDAYLYYDFGEGGFAPGSTHHFQWDWDAAANESAACFYALSNVPDDAAYWWAHYSQAIALRMYRNPTDRRVILENAEAHQQHYFNDYPIPGTRYWTVERTSETAIEARSYTDPERTILFHTHVLPLTSGRRFSHVFVINTWNDGQSAACSHHVRNLLLYPD